MSEGPKWISAGGSYPAVPGYYPTYWVMPDNEGIMPGSAHWDGERWSQLNVDYFINRPSTTAKQALDIAYENDMEA